MSTRHTAAGSRIDWVDHAKGICIVLVVMMHSTLGVEKALGETSWLNGFIEWARPFRMPDFFLISGLFLASRIERPWRAYLDTKVLHFAYFYGLWMTIQFAVKAPGFVAELGPAGAAQLYLVSFVEPLGTLWFIYVLALFFVAAKLLRRVPAVVVWPLAALLEASHIETGWMAVDEFAARFVYFYTGAVLAPAVFRFAARVDATAWPAVAAALMLWAAANHWLVASGHAVLPGVSIAAGLVGCGAVVAAATLMARSGAFAAVRHLGRNSLVVYLAFFLFMAASRAVLVRQDMIADAGTIALLVTAAGVAGPLVLERLVRHTRLAFLFVRPAFARLERRPAGALAGGVSI